MGQSIWVWKILTSQGLNPEPSNAQYAFFVKNMVAFLVSATVQQTHTLKISDTQIMKMYTRVVHTKKWRLV